jgi:ribokinase
MSRVVVIGSVNMDMFARVRRMPLVGETVAGDSFSFIPGGKGANQAVSSARLGAETLLVARVGDDSSGDSLLQFLEGTGVSLSYVSKSIGMSSGTALVVVSAKGENSIIVVPGANAELRDVDIQAVEMREGDIVLAQLEVPVEAISRAFLAARDRGAVCILNPTPASHDAAKLLDLADIIILNESELLFFGGAETEPSENAALCRRIRRYGEQVVILTLGSEGVLCVRGDDVLRIPGRRVMAVDTTGAGDCFVGALASQMARGVELEAALEYANIAASISVQRVGAAVSMPTLDEVTAVLGQLDL